MLAVLPGLLGSKILSVLSFHLWFLHAASVTDCECSGRHGSARCDRCSRSPLLRVNPACVPYRHLSSAGHCRRFPYRLS